MMPDADSIDGSGSKSVARRTILVGAVGALVTAGLGRPMRAAASPARATAHRRTHFDRDLERRLQQALRDGLADPNTYAPGAILHVQGPHIRSWTGTAGLGRVSPDVPMLAGDRFRAGSIAKPFVSAVVLQLVESGRLSLDARLPDVLPASIVDRFPTAPDATVRLLLGHPSGIPE